MNEDTLKSLSTNSPETKNGAQSPNTTEFGTTKETEGTTGNVSSLTTGVAKLPPSSSPSVPKPVSSLAQQVNSKLGAGMTPPKSLKGFNTNDEVDDYFHGLIYSETSARKTTSAAQMFGPENTLIVLCRQPEQLIPLRGEGFKVLHCEDVEALEFALGYPEVAAAKLLNWPEWGSLRDRALVLDDTTEAVDLLLEKNKTKEDGTAYKDMRKVYGLAGGDLKDYFLSLRRKKLHLPWISLAKVTTNEFTNEERVAPSLPPSMTGMLTTDLEFVFYIDKSKWKFVVESIYRSYVKQDEKTGKDKTFRREIFAKNKIPNKFLGRGIFPTTGEVKMDLKKIWQSVKNGTPIETVGGK